MSRLGTKTKQNNSKTNQLGQLRPLIIALMENEGRDFDICEICLESTQGKWEIHHTKYLGATYSDLQLVCRSCNRKYDNIYLS